MSVRRAAEKTGAPVSITGVGSLSCVFFTPGPVRNYADAKQSDTDAFAGYFRNMLDKGFYFAPSQFEAIFLSAAHTGEDIEAVATEAEVFWSHSSDI